MKTLLIAALLLLSAGVSQADTIWNYSGNELSPCGCSLTGTVTLDASGNPVSWNFSDGLVSLNTSDSFMEEFSEVNNFSTWKLRIVDQIVGTTESFFTQYYGSQFESSDASPNGHEQGAHGIWTDPPATTPESSALIYILIGGGVLMGFLLGNLYGLWRGESLALKRLA